MKSLMMIVLWSVCGAAFAQSAQLKIDLMNNAKRNRAEGLRVAALDALRGYTQHSDARILLARTAADKKESIAIRSRALQSLAHDSDQPYAYQVMTKIAGNRNEPTYLRAMAVRSLWKGVSKRTDINRNVRLTLTDDRYPLEMRKAAAFALVQASDLVNTKRDLIRVASNQNENTALRNEALKSLYQHMQYYDAEKAVKNIATDQNESEKLRMTALKLFQATVNMTTRNHRLLERIASNRGESLPLRAQAIRSTRRQLQEEDIRYFHLTRDINGNARDPFQF